MDLNFFLIKHYDYEEHIEISSYINPQAIIAVQDVTLEEEFDNSPPRAITGVTIRFIDGGEIFLLDDNAEFILKEVLGFNIIEL